jgi:superfamily II DNA or RNA helicase
MTDKIKLVVTNTATYIQGKLESLIYKDLKKLIGYRPEDAIFRMRRSNKHWDGIVSTLCYNKAFCHCAIKKDGTHFPTGLFNRVKDFLISKNIEFEVFDNREQIEKTLSLTMSKEGEIRDYQQQTIKDAVKRQRGIIKMATGGGKTYCGAGIIAELGISPFIFYVPSIDLLKQTRSELSKFLLQNGSSLKVGAIGGGEFDIQNINVMTTQTAVKACGAEYVKYDDEESVDDKEVLVEKRKDILDLICSAKGIIIDECQHCASETVQIISDYSINARYRWGVSATPYRDHGDDILIDACFGRVISEVNASYLINKGYLIKPEIFIVPIKEGMPSNLNGYQSYYKSGIVENINRNKTIASITKKLYEQGRNILILCKHIEHGKMLNTMIENSVFLHGATSGEERLRHLEKMRKREERITIASIIFDEGIDCRALDTLILSGSGKSSTRALQRIGRVLRPYEIDGYKKKDAIVIDFEDHCKYLLQHSKKRIKIYKTEPNFSIKYI